MFLVSQLKLICMLLRSSVQKQNYFWTLKSKVGPLKVFYSDRMPLVRKACLYSSWLNTDQSLLIYLKMSPSTAREPCGSTGGSRRRPHHQRWFQSWQVLSIMKKWLAHWLLLGNCISITVASQEALVGRFKGRDMQGYFSMLEKCVIYQYMQWGVS